MSVWDAVGMPNIKQDPEVFNFFLFNPDRRIQRENHGIASLTPTVNGIIYITRLNCNPSGPSTIIRNKNNSTSP